MNKTTQPLTCFSAGLDQLARTVAGWPEGAVVHTMEVLNGGGSEKNPQIMLEGSIPTGEKNGSATFKGCPRAQAFKAVVRLSEYRAAISEQSDG